MTDLFGSIHSHEPTKSLEQMERDAISAALHQHGTATEAAKQLKIGRATIHRKMRRYGIKLVEKVDAAPS